MGTGSAVEGPASLEVVAGSRVVGKAAWLVLVVSADDVVVSDAVVVGDSWTVVEAWAVVVVAAVVQTALAVVEAPVVLGGCTRKSPDVQAPSARTPSSVFRWQRLFGWLNVQNQQRGSARQASQHSAIVRPSIVASFWHVPVHGPHVFGSTRPQVFWLLLAMVVVASVSWWLGSAVG